VRRFLLLDVLLDDRQWCATATRDEVAAAPQHRFPIELAQVLRVVTAHQPGGHRLQTVDHHRDGRLRRQLERIVEVQKSISALETAAKQASGNDRHFPVSAKLKAAYVRRRALHAKVRASATTSIISSRPAWRPVSGSS
jgi:hypothetical protein